MREKDDAVRALAPASGERAGVRGFSDQTFPHPKPLTLREREP
jgi:hypothetical protein